MMKLDFSHLTLQRKSLLGAFDILKSIWSKPTASWCDFSRDKRHSFAVPLVHQAGVVLNPNCARLLKDSLLASFNDVNWTCQLISLGQYEWPPQTWMD